MSVFPAASVLIRRASRADLPGLIAIETASFSDAWRPRTIESALSEARVIVVVAQVGDETRGYGAAWSVGDEAEITRVAVEPSWRGRGLGAALLQFLTDECAVRGARRLFLEVRADNASARSLYARAGWCQVGLRRAYYSDGADALVLSREMDPRTEAHLGARM